MNTRSFGTRALLLALLFGLTAVPVLAQDDNGQAYKQAFNDALATAKSAQQAQNDQNLSEAEAQFTEAYEAFAQVSQDASAADDAQVAAKANAYAAQIAYKAGLISTHQENFENALQHFESGLEYYPQFMNNYLGRASALNKLDRADEAMAVYQEAIDAATEQGEYETAQKAENAIRDHYVYQASNLLGGDNVSTSAADEAIGYLEQLQEYVDADANTYFYLAAAYNAKGDYAQAVEMADQALELHNGSRSDAAKIAFIKGEALMNQGNEQEAVAAFEDATYGEYEAPARHYIEQLSGGTR